MKVVPVDHLDVGCALIQRGVPESSLRDGYRLVQDEGLGSGGEDVDVFESRTGEKIVTLRAPQEPELCAMECR